MNGSALYRISDGFREAVKRFDATAGTKKRLIAALEDGVPEGATILGIVFEPDERKHLRAVPLELKAS